MATFEATGDLHLYAIVCTNSLDSVYTIPLHPRSKGLHCGGGGGGGGLFTWFRHLPVLHVHSCQPSRDLTNFEGVSRDPGIMLFCPGI